MNDVTHSLLRDIEVKDRRFRFTQTLFFFLVALMLVVLLFASYRQQSDSGHVIDGQTKTLNTLIHVSKQRTEQINDLQKHIDCIVALFQQPNRSQVIITDIENCNLSELQASSVLSGNSGSTDSTTATPKDAQMQMPVQSAPSEVLPQLQGNDPMEPLNPLGVPACVPLIELCLDH